MPFEAERLADESGVLYSKQEVAPGRGQPRAQNESAAALSHMESSRATAISNVIPAISTWPKTAMVNSIWPRGHLPCPARLDKVHKVAAQR
jgi:hypothetical protein